MKCNNKAKQSTGSDKQVKKPQLHAMQIGMKTPIMPVKRRNSYYHTKKGCSTIACQALVDHDTRFMDVSVGWPGSVHDSRILRLSSLWMKIMGGHFLDQSEQITLPDGTVITPYMLGDSGYALVPFLMIPFPAAKVGPHSMERRFNRRFSGVRNLVERAFGQLKNRFQILMWKMMHDIRFCNDVIWACMILHNWLKDRHDELPRRFMVRRGLDIDPRRDAISRASMNRALRNRHQQRQQGLRQQQQGVRPVVSVDKRAAIEKRNQIMRNVLR